MQIWTSLHTFSRRVSGRLRQERGQSLVEFAVVLPVLILIILGILYFGRYENYSNQETQLASEGARWAAVNYTPSSGTLQSYILSQAQPELQNGSSDVTAAAVWIYQPTVGGVTDTYAVGHQVRVCVITTVKFPTPVGVPTTTMAESATMRIEATASGSATLPYSTAGNSADGNPSGTMPTQCPTT